MLTKATIRIFGIKSENDKTLLETEINILEGVKGVQVNEKTGDSFIEFEDEKISKERIAEAIKKLGFALEQTEPLIQERLYFVQGTHCASCELIIEKKLLALEGVKAVEAKSDKGQVLIQYTGKSPRAELLNSIFKNENYVFSDQPEEKKAEKGNANDFLSAVIVALAIIFGFLYLNKIGIGGLINVNSSSSLPSFFVLGLLAGVSSCAALVGGLVLSMSKQWQEMYSSNNSLSEKLQPHLLFNIGRIASYALFGAVLGTIGSRIQISLKFTSFLILAVSALMLLMALQMLGVRALRKFQFALPKSFTRFAADEKNFKGKYMPFLMGALTFFLPCGFTITAQGLALLSGSIIQGALIMAFFALGTAPALLSIGVSAIKFSEKPRLAYKFSRAAGILILFFALFNVNSQLNLLGITSFSDIKSLVRASQTAKDKDLAQIVEGKQLIRMDASSNGYSPNYFKVKAGIPVRWEITDKGTSGCTNAVISKSLFDGPINLTPGQVSVKEFTPTKPGKYKFSCWMGMVSGTIEVVGSSSSSAALASEEVPSGASGCGCGGGNGSSCH